VSLVDISQEIKKFFILIFDFEHYIPMYVLRATKGRYSTKFRLWWNLVQAVFLMHAVYMSETAGSDHYII